MGCDFEKNRCIPEFKLILFIQAPLRSVLGCPPIIARRIQGLRRPLQHVKVSSHGRVHAHLPTQLGSLAHEPLHHFEVPLPRGQPTPVAPDQASNGLSRELYGIPLWLEGRQHNSPFMMKVEPLQVGAHRRVFPVLGHLPTDSPVPQRPLRTLDSSEPAGERHGAVTGC